MSRQGNNFRYLHRRGGSTWATKVKYEPQCGSSRTPEEPVRRPRGLRGKDIGLYYRDRQLRNGGYRRKGESRKLEDYILTFKIPRLVIIKLNTDLTFISKLASKSNVVKEVTNNEVCMKQESVSDTETFEFKKPKLPPNVSENSVPNTSSAPEFIPIKSEVTPDYGKDTRQLSKSNDVKEETNNEVCIKQESISDTETFEFKKPKLPPNVSENPVPNTSSAPEFIPIKSEVTPDYGKDTRQLSFRGGGDFKYGYEDIIKDSFDQKLDECLANGIKIIENTKEINDLSEALKDEYFRMLKHTKYIKFLEFRKKLPTYSKSEDLLNVIENNQVIVISGETGCGKSTQVPQIILDDAMAKGKGGKIKILVTQPRRIAALSLAARVAEERAEKMGSSVGYVVRLERVDCRDRGSITFCTTGVLLVDLEIDQGLTKYSHIILDEVHERDTHIDLAMCMLKKVLKKRDDLKLILMSATIDADRLSAYYDNCPMMHIEGLAYPVKDIYLEEILMITGYQLPEDKKKQPKPWHKFKKNKPKLSVSEKEIQYRAEVGPWLQFMRESGTIDMDVYQTLSDYRIEEMNIDLILTLLIHISRGAPGAVLVFLPGIGDITKLLNQMNDSNAFPPSRFEVYPLHSKLPTVEQHRIFERPPEHIRKIIVATNIAETSITIDDIVYVIDCGKLKYSGLNVETYIATLQTEWISKANLRQRRGRAGRCQPGICYHMLTSYRADKLDDRLLPELQRNNLLEPVLYIKRLRLGLAETALKLVPDSPDMSTVRRAVKHLQQCGALNDEESLTPLGWHLARLPVHPAAGKLLVLGTLLGCLDRAASLASVWSFKDPFIMVIGREQEVDKVKAEFALGEASDHVAMSEAIIQWENRPVRERRDFAYNNFLSHNTLELLSDMKTQLGDNLKQMGFLASGNVRSSWENRNVNNLSIFKAVVAAALYPNIGSVRWFGLGGRKINPNPRIKVRTPEDGTIPLHPSSVMCVQYKRGGKKLSCTKPGANWLVYWLKQRSTELYLIDVTLIHTMPLLFFGELKIIEMEEDACLMSISTYKVRCPKEQADLLMKLRKYLDDVLASKITANSDHSIRHSDFEENVLRAVIDLITAEDEGVEYMEDDDDTTSSDASECEFHPNRS